MNKKYGLFCLITAGALSASATTVWLEGKGKMDITTGDGLDKINSAAKTVSVVEIPGLSMTAKSAGENQELNALSESFGVADKSNPSDNTSCLEGTEAVELTFDKAVHLSGIDFNHFDKDESFTIQIGETKHVISYNDLSNKITDTYECDLALPAGTTMRLSTEDSAAKIGLDSLEITADSDS
jgi:hypothetical protein